MRPERADDGVQLSVIQFAVRYSAPWPMVWLPGWWRQTSIERSGAKLTWHENAGRAVNALLGGWQAGAVWQLVTDEPLN